MSQNKLNALDSLFVYSESMDTKMHVGGLMPMTLPADAGPEYLRGIMETIENAGPVQAPWNLKLKNPQRKFSVSHEWVEDENFDIEYHVRRSALPSPGDERELGILISRLHSHPLDFSRPPWEMHLIEGLQDNRMAIYVKIHHSLVDGYTGMKMLSRSMSPDPDDRNVQWFFTQPQPPRPAPEARDGDVLASRLDQLSAGLDAAKALGGALWRLNRPARAGEAAPVKPMQAPMSLLNGRIGRNRRFATQQYEVAELRALAKAAGGTVNDIILALSSGGLRRFLLDMDALPERSMTAYLPVNIRPKDDPGGGNAVAAMLTSLATDIADPAERLKAIIASARSGKRQMEGMSASAIMAYSAITMSPFGLQLLQATRDMPPRLPLTFNLCISNVAGPEQPLYFNGAKIEAIYPVSLPTHGQALNITCQSYNGTMNFGFIGCRDTVPHLQKLALYTGETLQELREILG